MFFYLFPLGARRGRRGVHVACHCSATQQTASPTHSLHLYPPTKPPAVATQFKPNRAAPGRPNSSLRRSSPPAAASAARHAGEHPRPLIDPRSLLYPLVLTVRTSRPLADFGRKLPRRRSSPPVGFREVHLLFLALLHLHCRLALKSSLLAACSPGTAGR